MTGTLTDKFIHAKVGTPKSVYAAIIFYNDGMRLLKECVRSCHRIGLKTIMIDGKFSAFQDDNKYFHSTDGCLEYAKSVADIFIPSPRRGWQDKWGGQPIKRTQYFNVCDEGDFVIVIDGDEGFKTNNKINVQSLQYKYMRLKLWNYASQHTIVNVRGFRVYHDLCYLNRHCAVYRSDMIRKSGNNPHSGLAQYNRALLTKMIDVKGNELVMTNYDSLRPAQRQKWDDMYMSSRAENKNLAVVKKPSMHVTNIGTVEGTVSKDLLRRMTVKARLEKLRGRGF